MTSTFHINISELNTDFLDSVKKLFKVQKLFITIEEDLDETEYLLASKANRKALMNSLENVRKGKLIKVDIDQYLKK